MTGNPSPSETDMIRSASRRLQYAAWAVGEIADEVARVGRVVGEALRSGGKVLACGNGGSAAGAQHFAAEFTGKLKVDRPPLPAIALTTDTSALTAIGNDYGYDHVFSRQVAAHARPGDVVVGLSTSGTSPTVVRAFEAAKAAGAVTIGITGAFDGLGGDYTLAVPVRETARVQESHDLLLHEIAQVAERIVIPDLAWDASASPFDFVLTQDVLTDFRGWIAITDQRLVTTNGVFDLLHAGHRASLAAARREGDRLVVLVNDDESVRRLKGPSRPVRDQAARIDDLRVLPHVDHVVLMPQDDPRAQLEVLRPHAHAKGRDYEGRGLVEEDVVRAGGGRVVFIDLLPGMSTTTQIDQATGQSARDA